MTEDISSRLFGYVLGNARGYAEQIDRTTYLFHSGFYKDLRLMKTIGRCAVVKFSERFVDALELSMHPGQGTAGGHGHGVSRDTVIRALIDFDFPWNRTKDEWEQMMLADTDADKKISEAVARFNRSRGQFSRYDYAEAGYPSDYKFNTSVGDKVAMYIGFFRMIPVGSHQFANSDVLAAVPMCLQLESLMEGL